MLKDSLIHSHSLRPTIPTLDRARTHVTSVGVQLTISFYPTLVSRHVPCKRIPVTNPQLGREALRRSAIILEESRSVNEPFPAIGTLLIEFAKARYAQLYSLRCLRAALVRAG
jgi:hypothetical protein